MAAVTAAPCKNPAETLPAALSTGCRLGELLSLQWSQVQTNAKGEAIALSLSAGRTKTNQARVLPVGTRLRAVLAMLGKAPDGSDLPQTAFVFGDAVGGQVATIRAAWEETCAKAGIADLHFHDLRREFACRLLESSADLHDVKDFLGHANITTTSTYLASTPVRLADALAKMEAAPAAKQLHADCTNAPETTNGRAESPAVTH